MKKILASILAVMTLAMGAMFVGCNSNKKTMTEQAQISDGQHGEMLVNPLPSSGMRLMRAVIPASAYSANGISEQAESAYTLTATIMPSNASDQTVDWTVSWANAESDWAAGKSVADYVTVNPTSDGALVANVECLQAFGEQIVITVTSRDNLNVKAECLVDYAEKITKTDLKLSKNYMSDDNAIDFSTSTGYLKLYGVGSTGEKEPTFTTTTSIGTLSDEYEYALQLRFTDAFKTAANAVGVTLNSDFEMDCTEGFSTSISLLEAMFGTEAVNTPETYNQILDYIKTYGGAEVEFVLTATGTYSSKVDTYVCFLDTSNMAVRVTGLSIDDSSLII